MIKELTLKDFKGIKEGKIEFAPLTILLGSNNSGKTTVLEALFLIPNPFRKVPYPLKGSYGQMALEVVLFLHETLNSRSPISLFHNYVSDIIELTCTVDSEIHSLRFLRDDSQLFVTTNKQIKGAQTNKIKDVPITWFGRIDLSSYVYGPIYSQECLTENTLLITSSLMKSAFQYLKNNWAPIANSGISSRVAREVSMLTPENYINITIEPFVNNELSINVLLEDGRRIRLGDLGEGAQMYIISRILFDFSKSDVLLWDDVESHFNPRILLRVAEWFSELIEKSRQVIVTTHSLEATKLIADLNEKNVSILLTSLDNNKLKTKKLSLSDIEDFLRAGIDVRVAESMLL
ncbi:MAG: AAA family ATPase [Candidatus Odinarchaeota archaeon]|nr:AAA family ATPase [Candidatus Odinarchaeota archaeon]